MIGVVRMWKEKDMSGNDIDVIELIDDSLRRKFVDRVPQEPEELHWNDVPCVAFENPDGSQCLNRRSKRSLLMKQI